MGLDTGGLGRLVNVHFRVGMAVGLLLAAAGAITLYVMIPQWRPFLPFSMGVIAGSIALYGAYYARATLISRLETDRLRRTFEILDRLGTPELARIRRSVQAEVDPSSKNPVELYRMISADLDLYTRVTVLLGLYEDLAIAIQVGYADEEVLFKSVAGPVKWAWEHCSGFVQERRKITGRPMIYREMERLANAWGNGQSLSLPLRRLTHDWPTHALSLSRSK